LPPKANTTANPIHLDPNHPTEGRSFKVKSPAMIDQTYRRLRSALNQSNMKRELRLRRNYEDGHTRMRRENQERNKKLFGAMVRKKIELIKLMKIR
jgi:ribosomal protein S21